MDYRRIYNNLIKHRQNNPVDSGYTEKHHIIMRSLGGSNEKDNIVALTAREHFIAHLLLARFNPCLQTILALHMMQCKSKFNSTRKIIKGRLYEWLRTEHSKYLSELAKLQQNDPIYKLNHSLGSSIGQKKSYENGRTNGFKDKKHSIETKEKISNTFKTNGHNLGAKNGNYGKKCSEEMKDRIRLTLSKKPLLQCPFCLLESRNKGMLNRFHFNNCKKEASVKVTNQI
jgi:hypothetical protein